MRRYRVIAVGFDHMHVGDQLAAALENPATEVVGAFANSPDRAQAILDDLGIGIPVSTDLEQLLAEVGADIAFVCSTTADHLRLVTELARHGVHVILEKPMADSTEAAIAMVGAAADAGTILSVNWPLAWVPSHRTAKRLVASGAIGRIEQVHFYDGNRGPLFHSHGKIEMHPTLQDKAESWWYQPESGGGSLRDYLGYGTTLATWFRDGELPNTVTAVWHVPVGLKVDEQSVVVAHYDDGLSVFETRWGTHTDPWTVQPEPRCGFILTGPLGSITSWDYDDGVTLHAAGAVTRVPNDDVSPDDASALANLIAHLERSRPIDEPMTAATSLQGHLILEAAFASATSGLTVSVRQPT